MMKKGLTLLLPLSLTAATFTATAQSLQEAIVETLRTNPDVYIEAETLLASEQALRGARGAYFPSVDIFAGYGRQHTNRDVTFVGSDPDTTLTPINYGAELRQLLFDGFGTQNEVARNAAIVKGDEYRLDQTSQDAALSVIEVYLDYLRRLELVAVNQENLQVHAETLNNVRKRRAAGLDDEADVEQAISRYTLAEAELTEQEGFLLDAEASFIRIVGQRPENLLYPGAPRFPDSVDEAIDLAHFNHPAYLAARADMEAAAAEQRATYSLFSPRVDLVLGAWHFDDADGVEGRNDQYFAMLELNYNIFRGGSDYARVQEAVHKKDRADQVARQVSRFIQEDIRLSWSAYITALEQLGIFQERVRSSQATANAYDKQFALGERTLLDLLSAQNEVFVSHVQEVNAKYAELFGQFMLLHGAGVLLDELQIPGYGLPADALRRDHEDFIWVREEALAEQYDMSKAVTYYDTREAMENEHHYNKSYEVRTHLEEDDLIILATTADDIWAQERAILAEESFGEEAQFSEPFIVDADEMEALIGADIAASADNNEIVIEATEADIET